MIFGEGTGAPEEEHPRTRAFSPVALIWALLIVAGSIYRACAGG